MSALPGWALPLALFLVPLLVARATRQIGWPWMLVAVAGVVPLLVALASIHLMDSSEGIDGRDRLLVLRDRRAAGEYRRGDRAAGRLPHPARGGGGAPALRRIRMSPLGSTTVCPALLPPW